jgi:hypothetical protein
MKVTVSTLHCVYQTHIRNILFYFINMFLGFKTNFKDQTTAFLQHLKTRPYFNLQ